MNSVICTKAAPLLAACIAFTVAGLTFSAEDPGKSTLRAGAATSNITPPLGTLRVGSFAPYPSVHVHDELYARCLVLDDGQITLALVVVDLVGFHRSVSVEARRAQREHHQAGLRAAGS